MILLRPLNHLLPDMWTCTVKQTPTHLHACARINKWVNQHIYTSCKVHKSEKSAPIYAVTLPYLVTGKTILKTYFVSKERHSMSYNTAVTVFLPFMCIFGILPALACLASLTIPPFVSEQCAEPSPDFGGVLMSVAKMVSSSNPTELSHPLSCLEVKESSPSSPSGCYTLSDGTGNTNIVYCNTNDLYSCPSLEQVLQQLLLQQEFLSEGQELF